VPPQWRARRNMMGRTLAVLKRESKQGSGRYVSDLRRKRSQQHQCTVAEMFLQVSCPHAERRARIVRKKWQPPPTPADRRGIRSCSCSHETHRCVPRTRIGSASVVTQQPTSSVQPRCAPAEPLPTEVRRTEAPQETSNRGAAAQRR
jgi:hypothetical protein